MKNSNLLLIISSVATGAVFVENLVYAQQTNTNNTLQQLIYNNSGYLTKTIKLNDRSDIVKHIQSTFNLYFGTELAEDGVYGKLTEETVESVQKILGIDVDGVFGSETARSLFKYTLDTPIDDQDGFSTVPAKTQSTFMSLGYNVNATGNLSSYDTILAIRDFQRKNRLHVTERLDLEELNKINEKVKEYADETKKFKSDTNYYIVTNSGDYKCKVYQKTYNTWKEVRKFDVISGKIDKGTYKLGLQGKELNLNGISMKNFVQIDGLNVFYSAVADARYGLRVSHEDAEFLNKIPKNTTVKIY